MMIKEFFERLSEKLAPFMLVLVSGFVLFMLANQYKPFLKSLKAIVYSFSVTGSFRTIAITVIVLGFLLCAWFFVLHTLEKKNKEKKVFENKFGVTMFKVLIFLLSLTIIEAVVIIAASFSAHPLIGNHAISLVHYYESTNDLPRSDLVLGWSHNDLITAESFTQKSENYLVYSLDGYENLQIGLWGGVPFTFHKNIKQLEQSPEEALTYLNKTLYVVYDLKDEPKLLIFEPEVLKKHVKLIPKSTAGSMEVGAVLILDVEEAVQQENIKPVKL